MGSQSGCKSDPDCRPADVEVFNAGWTALGVLVITVVLLSTHKLGFRSARYVFTEYDSSFSGWGEGFTFCIGLLPAAYVGNTVQRS